MTNEDKVKAKEKWASLSEAEKEAANAEWHEIIQWWREEEHKTTEKLKAEGRYLGGLDGYYPERIATTKEAHKKMRELRNRIFGTSSSD